MTVLDDIHDRHTILDNLSTMKLLTYNLSPGTNIVHGDALYATKNHLTQHQTIAIVQTHAWKLRHINTPAKHHGFAPIHWRTVDVEVGVKDVVNVLNISSMEKKNLFITSNNCLLHQSYDICRDRMGRFCIIPKIKDNRNEIEY